MKYKIGDKLTYKEIQKNREGTVIEIDSSHQIIVEWVSIEYDDDVNTMGYFEDSLDNHIERKTFGFRPAYKALPDKLFEL